MYNNLDKIISINMKSIAKDKGEKMVKPEQVVSNATLKRLPIYLRYLQRLKGVDYISSVTIAEHLKLNSVQVKKDIALVSTVDGKPKVGFELSRLIKDLEDFLGCNNSQNACLVGVGKLGSALLSYKGYEKYGLKIVAGFEINEDLFGKEVGGTMIYPMSELESYIKENKIYMAIIAVQSKDAQSVANKLVDAGVLAIMNFAPERLNVPEHVALQSVDIAATLAILSTKLKVMLDNKEK